MYQILMPVDENEERSNAQVDYVLDLLDIGESVEVVLLYVFDEEDSIDPDTDESNRSIEDVQAVTTAIDRLGGAGVDYRTIKDRGGPVDAILEQADQHGVDSIVLGGRKRSSAGKLLFGSVTQSILRSTDIPVVVTGHAGTK